MSRNNDRDRAKSTRVKPPLRRGRPKVCRFCADGVVWIDYKDAVTLRRYLSDRAKIKSRDSTGTCLQHQRHLAVAIKTARELALLPYVQRPNAVERGGRTGRDRRGRPSASQDKEETSPNDNNQVTAPRAEVAAQTGTEEVAVAGRNGANLGADDGKHEDGSELTGTLS